MRKRLLSKLVFILLTGVLVVSGCNTISKISPELVFVQGYKQAAKVNSFNINSTIKLDSSLPAETKNTDIPNDALKNLKLELTGKYQKNPAKFDGKLTIDIENPKISQQFPIIWSEDKLWVKVDLLGKYIEVDMKKYDASEKQEGVQSAQKDIIDIFIKNFDAKTYFSSVDKKSISIPSDIQVEKMAKFSINDQNIDTALNTLVKKVAPEILNLLLSDQYKKNFTDKQIKELEKAQKQLKDLNKEDADQTITEAKEKLGLRHLEQVIGTDKQNNITYSETHLDVKNETISQLNLDIVTSYSGFNQKVEVNDNIPTSEIIKLEELLQMGQELQEDGQLPF